ncbi:MAG: type II secretion system F family protein [Propionicimonas sp.]
MRLVAVAAVLVAGLILVAGSPRVRLRNLTSPEPAASARTRWPTRMLAPGLLAVVVSCGMVLGGAAGAVVAFALGTPLATGVLVWRRHSARADAARTAAAVAEACRQLAGLLRLGHVPAAALRVAAADSPLLAEVVAVQQVGGEVAPVLGRLGSRPGAGGLTELAAAWRLAERTGASLGATLDALAEQLAAAGAVTDVVSAELAAPRATGRLLAALPVAGLLLGYGLGGDPLAFLTGSPVGQACLAVGVTLGCAGVLWTERIADAGDG